MRPDDLRAFAGKEPPEHTAADPAGSGTAGVGADGGGDHGHFLNTLDFAVDYLWIDPEGRRHPYGTLAPGESRDMGTFSGHVWIAVRHDDNTKAIVAFIAEDRSSTALIAVPDAATRPTSRPGGGGRARRGQQNASPYRAVIRDFNLYVTSPDGTETQLTTDGKADDAYTPRFTFSPDGNKLVVYKTIPEQTHTVYEVESSPTDQKQPPPSSTSTSTSSPETASPWSGRTCSTWQPRRTSRSRRTCSPIRSTSASRGGRRTRGRSPSPTTSRGHQAFRVISVDAASGGAAAVIDEASTTFIDYSGKQFLDYDDATREIIWMSERDGWNHLYLYDEATGAVKNQITKGEWVVRGVDKVDHEKRGRSSSTASGNNPDQDPYYVHYARINFDGTGLTWLTQANGTHKLAYSPDGSFYFDTYSRVDLPPVVELHRAIDGAKLLDLIRADAGALLKTGWHFPEPFVAKGRDGKTDIYGVIYRPNNFDPARKYPVIENIYAGPQDSYVPKAFGTNFNALALAQLGFITVQIDGMGTSNRSKAFHDVCYKNLADAGFPDRILWMQAAAKKVPVHGPHPRRHLRRRCRRPKTQPGPSCFPPALPGLGSTRRPSPTAAVTTTRWTTSGGTNNGWATRSARSTPRAPTSTSPRT